MRQDVKNKGIKEFTKLMEQFFEYTWDLAKKEIQWINEH